MKIKYHIVVLLFLAACGPKPESPKEKAIKDAIVIVQKKYAPDSREDWFHISLKNEAEQLKLIGETDSKEAKEELLVYVKKISTGIIEEIRLLPDSSVADKPFALVKVSVANFRGNPANSAEMVTQAVMGTPVKLLKQEKSWFLAQTPDRYIGWVDEGGIIPLTNAEFNGWKSSKRLVIKDDYGVVKAGPNPAARNISDYTMGMIVENTGKEVNYLKVKLPDQRTGFIPEGICEDFDSLKKKGDPNPSALIETALHLTGRPYLWGGTSVVGMDCSGFVKTVYFMNGVILARDASLQARHGLEITNSPDFTQFQPGDLVFFGRKATAEKPERVTHVGMIVDGRNYIHEYGIVGTNSLDPQSAEYSDARYKAFVKARRIMGHIGEPGIQAVGKHPWY